jgi:hypothetical protein
MRNILILLVALIALFLGAQGVLHLIYGPSFPWLPSEDEWIPDGNGGWIAHGAPSDPQPAVPSENVPIVIHYLPIFLPALVLFVFLFTPLRHKLDKSDDGPVEVEIEGSDEIEYSDDSDDDPGNATDGDIDDDDTDDRRT